MRARKRFAALTVAILTALSGAALAQEYDAQQAKSWMAQFAQALLQFSPINDPAQTLDPARPGEYLQEYEFGTVQAATSGTPTAAQIEEIDVSTAQVKDARGVRVGMTLSEALGGLIMVVAATGACGLGAALAGRTALLKIRHGKNSFRSGANSGIIHSTDCTLEIQGL